MIGEHITCSLYTVAVHVLVCITPYALQIEIKWTGDDEYESLLDYTSVPLDTTQCVSFPDTCSAMQAVTDSLNTRYNLRYSNRTCSLTDDCLNVACEALSFTTTLLPCDSAVTISGELFNNEAFTFTQSRVQYFFYESLFLVLDVILVELQDSEAIGLQVRQSIV